MVDSGIQHNVSAVQQSDSVTHIHIYRERIYVKEYIFLCIFFHYGLLQDIVYSSLCYTVNLVVYLFYIQ